MKYRLSTWLGRLRLVAYCALEALRKKPYDHQLMLEDLRTVETGGASAVRAQYLVMRAARFHDVDVLARLVGACADRGYIVNLNHRTSVGKKALEALCWRKRTVPDVSFVQDADHWQASAHGKACRHLLDVLHGWAELDTGLLAAIKLRGLVAILQYRSAPPGSAEQRQIEIELRRWCPPWVADEVLQ